MQNKNRRMKLWLVAAGLMLTALGTVVLARADKKGPAGSALVSDKGKLNILIDGKSIGREEFEISPNGDTWIAKGTKFLRDRKRDGLRASEVYPRHRRWRRSD